MDNVLVIGAGSWGTAFAAYLVRNGHGVRLWVREPELAEAIASRHENTLFLPGIGLPPSLAPVTDLAAAVAQSELLVLAVPSKFMRTTLTPLAGRLDHIQGLVNLSKGIEAGSQKTLSEVAMEVLGLETIDRWTTLSGPSFALEVAQGHPSALVAAAVRESNAVRVQQLFSSPQIRIYRSTDLTGVEIGGSIKNVMAIASGMIAGLGFGTNTTATMVTRASVEISRLGVALGARPETFFGLAGIGDLMLTCFGSLSRNYQLGRRIASGETLEQALAATPMVAEGVETARAVQALANAKGIDMPIVAQVHEVLFRGKPPAEAMGELMTRSLKSEWITK
ncbi:MAG TPA: NAD(P)H-dependent glycerol-3-phosphate dehydrogenase [Candidatus Aminicenantes bacterium]|nr:NAD(P)H-dependent glycerol-3-phosphate dehydrogenase [Candidatus Aminicenantes bacterium]